jgi:serine/threonine protein kinase
MMVAVKTLNEEQQDREKFLKEAKMMMSLHHPYIVRFLDVLNDDKLLIIQEYLHYGALIDFLQRKDGSITHDLIIKWAGQIASGMEYLESQAFIHRDLAARNILMGRIDVVKISDFGLSKMLGADQDYYKSIGGTWPVKWYAPECYEYGRFTSAGDIWR